MDQIHSLFPLTFEITEDIIKGSDPLNPINCVGARSLKKAVGDIPGLYIHFGWLETFGRIITENGHREKLTYFITTEEKIDMMKVRRPIIVTFISK